jgi:hypothetical protein
MNNISINMAQMKKWKVTSDNVIQYEAILQCNGKFSPLDLRPFIYWLDEFNIFYTATYSGPVVSDIREKTL